jgi:hypothetical protein
MTTLPTSLPNGPTLSEPDAHAQGRSRALEVLKYLAVGVAFGILMVKSEVVSWYRIQEMFRFQSFSMYGVLGSAMLTAFVSLEPLKRTAAHALTGELISVPAKNFGAGSRYWIGGIIFGPAGRSLVRAPDRSSR